MNLVVFLTQRCNFQCKHCLNRCPYDEELPFERYKRAIELLQTHGLKSVTFTGGEPILHKEFKKVAKYTAKKKVSFILVSNGYLYKQYRFLLQHKRFKTVYLSLDGLEKTHDSNRQKGSYKRVIEAIDYFHSQGVSVKINFTLTKYNFAELNDVLKILANKRIKEVHLASVIENEVNRDMILDISKRRDVFWNAAYLSEKYNMKVVCINSCYNYGGGFFCSVLDKTKTIYLNQRGEMIYCCDIRDPHGKLGILNEENLQKLIAAKLDLTSKIRTDRLIKSLKGTMSEIQEHSCEYCHQFFKKRF